MRLGASGRQFPNPEARVEYFRQFADRIAAVPGVQVRGAVTALPFTSSVGWGSINVEGWTPQPGQELQVDQRAATPDYFRTMEIPVREGRCFSSFDTLPNAERVVIIDEKFAQRFWPGQSAIGKHLWNDPKQPMTIVGVVGHRQAVRPRRGRTDRGLSSEPGPARLSGGADVAAIRRRCPARSSGRSTRSIRRSRCTTSGP